MVTVPLTDATQSELEAFFEEIFVMKNFSHPNIVGLLGVCLDSEDGFPYIVMPFMSNGNLKEFLKRNRTHLTDISTMPRVSNELYFTNHALSCRTCPYL